MDHEAKMITGPAYVLGDNIDTDAIIPASHLSLDVSIPAERKQYGRLAMSGLPADAAPFVEEGATGSQYAVIVAGSNFGCGSSREHAPWALEVNDITLVVGESFARIFRQNMFNCGMMAVELPAPDIERIFMLHKTGAQTNVTCEVNLDKKQLWFNAHHPELAEKDGNAVKVNFTLNEFDEALVRSGGWVEFADERY